MLQYFSLRNFAKKNAKLCEELFRHPDHQVFLEFSPYRESSFINDYIIAFNAFY